MCVCVCVRVRVLTVLLLDQPLVDVADVGEEITHGGDLETHTHTEDQESGCTHARTRTTENARNKVFLQY